MPYYLYLSPKRYERLKKIALNMYKKYEIKEFPIDPFLIAEKEGITIIKYSEIYLIKNEESSKEIKKLFLEASRDAFIILELKCIVYNDQMKNSERILNSIMHELAHYFCGHKTHSQLAETEANFLARYFRAPIPIICCMSFENSIQLAEYFQLSEESAGYAFSNAEALKNNNFENVNIELFNSIINHFDERGDKYELRL